MDHFTLKGIWKDHCEPHGPNSMCKVHDYPFYECTLMMWRLKAQIINLTRLPMLRADDKYWRDMAYQRWLAANPALDGLSEADAFVSGWQMSTDELRDDTLRQGEVINALKADLKSLSAGKLLWAEDAKKAHAEAERLRQEYVALFDNWQATLTQLELVQKKLAQHEASEFHL